MSIADVAIPAAEHAERTILGALMLDPARLYDVAAALNAEDFVLDSHKRIFLAMLELAEAGTAIDSATLPQYLKDQHALDAVGGWAYVLSLTDGLPMRPEIDSYLEIVKNKSVCRRMIAISESLQARAFDGEESGVEIATWGIGAISSVVDSGRIKVEVFDSPRLAIEAEQRLLERREQTTALPTGLLPLDEFTGGGIRLGELWIVGAAPSRGKTTLARQIALHTVCRGVPAYVQSGEMDKESWFDVSACLLAGLSPAKAREPMLLNLPEREALRSGIRQLAEMPLYISDTGSVHIDRLLWNAQRERRRHDIRLLVVDYAQIVKAPGRSKMDEIGTVAERLRVFAKDEQVAVLLLSQMARPEGRNVNARPSMFGLKETGRLEEAAHTVLLPFRPVDPESGAFTAEDEIIVGKQRWGGIGSVRVRLNGKYLRFDSR